MRQCKYCLEDGGERSPCDCKGSMRWVHESCLAKHREINNRDKCEICHQEYKKDIIFLIGFITRIIFLLDWWLFTGNINQPWKTYILLFITLLEYKKIYY